MIEPAVGRSLAWQALSHVEIFSELAESDLEELVAAAKTRFFKKGEVIYHQEDPSGSIFVVASGFVKLQLTSPTGKRVTIGWRQEQGWFGVLSFFDQEERPVNAICLEDSWLLAINRDFFRQFLAAHPEFAYPLLESMAKSWRRTIEKLYELAFMDAPGRLINVLTQLSSQYDPESEVRLRPSITQSELASFARTSRENVNKWLNFFERKGWVETSPKGLRILDVKALNSFIGYQ